MLQSASQIAPVRPRFKNLTNCWLPRICMRPLWPSAHAGLTPRSFAFLDLGIGKSLAAGSACSPAQS